MDTLTKTSVANLLDKSQYYYLQLNGYNIIIYYS